MTADSPLRSADDTLTISRVTLHDAIVAEMLHQFSDPAVGGPRMVHSQAQAIAIAIIARLVTTSQ